MCDDRVIGLPTLAEFLDGAVRSGNSYVDYPGFASLYLRKGSVGIVLDAGGFNWCHQCVTIANITARNPGSGAFTALVADLISRGFAIFIENVNAPLFRIGLLKRGWTQVNFHNGFMFLNNYAGHLEPV